MAETLSLLPSIHQAKLAGQNPLAIELLRQAIEAQPDFIVYHELLAETLYESDNIASLRSAIDQGLKLSEGSALLNELQEISGFREDELHDPITGLHDLLPDTSGARQASGGLRLTGQLATSKDDQPLISIVTVVYNNAETIERCLLSVAQQTYPNIEHIVIDGGSNDGTLEVLSNWNNRLGYYVSEPDGGIYAAMNKGMTLARGEYICLLNSDDFYEPKFVANALQRATESDADIVYTDYHHDGKLLTAGELNSGVMLGHANICHNTFLARASAYDRIGGFREEFRIVSDAVWIRAAFRAGLRFTRLNEALFTLTEGGMSSGGSERLRTLFISEVVQTYIEQFPFLTNEEAEELYLLRFNNKRIPNALEIVKPHLTNSDFKSATQNYFIYCFSGRDNFKLSEDQSESVFKHYASACALLDLPLSAVKIQTSQGCLSEFLSSIEQKITERKKRPYKTVLHYASVFSRPSETFIYNLVKEMEQGTRFDNFVLHDHELLAQERPYKKAMRVPWDSFRPSVQREVYSYLFKTIAPDVVVVHFAINEWKLNQRLAEIEINVPTVCMTHGVDVFELRTNPVYKDYLVNQFAARSDSRFTAVSNYLQKELVEHGVPPNKIDLIPNAVNPDFFAHRKTDNYYRQQRPLKIVTIGRLVEWKGHIELIEGIAEFRNATGADVELTIVYGNSDDFVSETQNTISACNMDNQVQLVPFVDLSANKGYLAEFDLYIQPSKFTNDALGRGETFGVAPLEAILSGLPVIVTNTGGLPEVIGAETRFAKIVNHGDSQAIADALEHMHNDQSCFADNIEYAEDRLSTFSVTNRLSKLAHNILLATDESLSATLFSTSTVQGAGYAALRVFRGIRESRVIHPTFFTTVRNHENEDGLNVASHPSGNGAGWNLLQDQSNSKPGMTIFTYNHPHISNTQLSQWADHSDVINLHWTARFLSIENIAYLLSLGKPVALTFRDMQPITGGCHFFHGCNEWKRGCHDCPQLIKDFDQFPSKVLAAKRKHYDFNNLTLVAISNHSANILRQAPFFNDCRIEVIPNSIETEVFVPMEKNQAKQALGLPTDKKIIGYFPSFSSEVKGYREAIDAFTKLSERDDASRYHVMLAGNRTPLNDEIPLAFTSLGYLGDNPKMAIAYSACDVVIVPSLEETFSNTTAEAISCGTPVVGFKTGAIPDMALDGVTGYTYEPGDSAGLATGIIQCIDAPQSMAAACREFAEKNLHLSIQAARYEKLFRELALLQPEKTVSGPTSKQEADPAFMFPELSQSVVQIYNSVSI